MSSVRLGVYCALAVSGLTEAGMAAALIIFSFQGSYMTPRLLRLMAIGGAMMGWSALVGVFSVASVIVGVRAPTSAFVSPATDITALLFFFLAGAAATGSATWLLRWDDVWYDFLGDSRRAKPSAVTVTTATDIFAGMRGLGWVLLVMLLAWLITTIVVTKKFGSQWKRSWASLRLDRVNLDDTTPVSASYQLDSQSIEDSLVPPQPMTHVGSSLTADLTGRSQSIVTPFTGPEARPQTPQHTPVPQAPVQAQEQLNTQQTATSSKYEYHASQRLEHAQQQQGVQHYTQPFIQAEPSTYRPQETTYIVQPASSPGFTTNITKM